MQDKNIQNDSDIELLINRDWALKMLLSPPYPVPVVSMQVIWDVTHPIGLAAKADYDAGKERQRQQYAIDKKTYDDYWKN